MTEEELLIPGKKITFSQAQEATASYQIDKESNLNVNSLFDDESVIKNNLIFQPIVIPYRHDNYISVKAITFINNTLLINPIEPYSSSLKNPSSSSPFFKYYYIYSLNYNEIYELTIYITFHEARDSRDILLSVSSFCHDFKFYPESFKDAHGQLIPLKNVENVKVFLVNTNPKTSRGTTTTVQSGG